MQIRSLAALALSALVVMPVAAQDDGHVWNGARPDALLPAGIDAAQMLIPGTAQLRYDYLNARFDGIGLGTTEISPELVLDFYAQTPFERTDVGHEFGIAWQMSDHLMVLAEIAWLERTRGVANGDVFDFMESSGVTDLAIDLLFPIYRRDAIRAYATLGGDMPTGSIDEVGADLSGGTVTLPFDMQLGTGSVVLRPGFSIEVQNEFATVGTRVQGRFVTNENDRGYRYGNGVDAQGWAAYALNSVFAVTGGISYSRWGDMSGMDVVLDRLADPGQDPIFSAGSRLDLPVGTNIVLPETSALAGTVVSAQFLFPVYQSYDRPSLRGDTSFRLSLRYVVQGN